MEMVESLSRGLLSQRASRWLSLALSVLLGMLLVVLFARSARIATGNPPSFDGAMNLQVAASLAKGDGYRRDYAEHPIFPHEIQTGPPYILPAAAVFKLWGVGIPQAEVVNLVYLALLLAITCWLIAPMGGWPLALFGACTVVTVPGVHLFGFYGFGEIPALAWGLAATLVYFHGGGEAWRGFVAGVMLALAVYTKTVMLIGAAALGLCAILEILVARRIHDHGIRHRFAAFVAGGAATVVSMETWRALALGGVHAWRHWWRVEAGNIFMQAGVKPGLETMTHSLFDKLQVHFALLADDYRMSLIFTGVWLILLLVVFAMLLIRAVGEQRIHWTAITVLLTALIYLAWWLLVTPTAKAWHRRILDGMICADIGLIVAAATWWRRERNVGLGTLHKLSVFVALVALLLPAAWLVEGARILLVDAVSEKACEWQMADAPSCAQLNPDDSVFNLQRVVREVRALPANAYVFAFGWYSAPRIGLLAQRYILDFHDVPVATMDPRRPVYFVQEPDTPPESLRRIRTLYDVTRTPDYAYALIQAHSLTPAPLVAGKAPVRRYVNAAEHYVYLRGFNDSEGANGRWLTDDNEALLVPQPGDVFELTAYAVPADRYEVHRSPNIIVNFDGCKAQEQTARPGEVTRLVFVIPAHCGIIAGKPVNVRIEVDNLVESAITNDPRALGVVAKSLGFVPAGSGEAGSRENHASR